MDVFEEITAAASGESGLWARAALPSHQRQLVAVFSPLAPDRFELGLETVYEAYLVHYGRSRLFDPADETERVLLGDYLYAHGLVRIAACGDVDAVADLSELISLSSQLRAEDAEGDGPLWAATASLLGAGSELDRPRAALRLRRDAEPLASAARAAAGDEAVERALAAHAGRVET